MAIKIHCNDEVIVLAGKDKGKCGRVKNVFSNRKAIVNNINLVKKHQKPIPSIGKLGGIIEKESIIDISNLAIFNVNTNKKDKVIFKIENGKKIRIFKSNGKIIK